MADHDVIVIGAGAMGSAALYHLSRRGLRVLGLERFEPGHDRGSSHGLTRIIRLGYFEDPAYVPLLHRTYALWRELETASRRQLLHVTGIAEIGPPDGELVRGTLRSAERHGLPHEVVAADELQQRLPALRLPDHYIGVLQPDGGYLEAEPAIHAHVALARAAGAELRTNVTVHAVEPHGRGVQVLTDAGSFRARTAIVAAGPWLKKLMPSCAPLRVTRQVIAWFAPKEPALFTPDRFPVFLLESRHGIHYGFPLLGEAGVKIAKHYHRDETVDPDAQARSVTVEDEDVIRAAIADHLPAADGPLVAAKSCLYTMTPDGHFILDRLPHCPAIIIASPCSGHGFKFAPVIGEILADFVESGTTRHDISRFRLGRFG
jgi:sarcosine oxidase